MSHEEAKMITWKPGLTIIRHEQRIEDDAIVFGSYIDNVWLPYCRMVFDGDKETRSMAIAALARVVK